MAIATNGGHVARAIDFYYTEGKYFIIGGTTPWANESSPTTPSVTDYKLRDVVGLKKVDHMYLVAPTTSTVDVISYRNQNWKKVSPTFSTTVGSAGVTVGSNVVPVTSLESITVGTKLRINDSYEGTVSSISGLLVTLDTAAPAAVPVGSKVLGGAIVENAKYVYLECFLNYDEFPVVSSYRQIGLCTGVTPNTVDILKAAAYSTTSADEFTSLGTLEILDNRLPSPRDINQRELLSLIIEF